jgi:hypothetical protein
MPAQQAKSSQSNAGSNFLEKSAKGCHGEEEERPVFTPLHLGSPVHVVPPLFKSYRFCEAGEGRGDHFSLGGMWCENVRVRELKARLHKPVIPIIGKRKRKRERKGGVNRKSMEKDRKKTEKRKGRVLNERKKT